MPLHKVYKFTNTNKVKCDALSSKKIKSIKVAVLKSLFRAVQDVQTVDMQLQDQTIKTTS